MSLLMEALKKAEQAKQEASAPEAKEEAALTLEPAEPAPERAEASFPELDFDSGTGNVSAAPDAPVASLAEPALTLAVETPPAPEPLPQPVEATPEPKRELALELTPPPAMETPAVEPLPAPVAAEPPPPPPPLASTPPAPPAPAAPKSAPAPSAPRTRTAQAAKQQARNVFSAKDKGAKSLFGLSKPALAVAGVGVALLFAGTGYYFYRELNPPLMALQPGRPAPIPPAPAAPLPPPAAPVAEALPTAPPEAPPAEAPAETPKARKAQEFADAPPDRGEIRIQHGGPVEQMNPHLAQAYQAAQAGNLSEAQDAYRKVLQADRNNRDALLGLASLRERKGDAEGAAGLYQRLLELDPNDGAAQAGLTGLGQGDPVRSEGRLKSLLAQQPDSDALNFALGNLYASQQRWPDAQQSYFRAFQKQPGNPDYLYNLAVSLDHLGQNKVARDYYQRALSAANRPHNFSPEEVRGRIEALEQAAPRQ